MDLLSSPIFQRLTGLGRVLGLRVTFTGTTLDLSLEIGASERAPSWSTGAVARPETKNYRTGERFEAGLLCPTLFGDPPDPRRVAHIALVEPVIPWPERVLLAEVVGKSPDELLTLYCEDPTAALMLIEAAGAPCSVWWSIPVVSPPLRVMSVDADDSGPEGLQETYRRIVNRQRRLERMRGLEITGAFATNERQMAVAAIDELLANRELAAPKLWEEGDDEVVAYIDATTLFCSALTPAVVSVAEPCDHAGGWIAEVAELFAAPEGEAPVVAKLWRIAGEHRRERVHDGLLRALCGA